MWNNFNLPIRNLNGSITEKINVFDLLYQYIRLNLFKDELFNSNEVKDNIELFMNWLFAKFEKMFNITKPLFTVGVEYREFRPCSECQI